MRTTPIDSSQSLLQRVTPNQIRLGLSATLAVVTTIAFVAYLITSLNWLDKPFLGVTVNHTMTVNASVSSSGETWTGKAAGLRAGDQIVEIDGTPVANNSTSSRAARHYTDILSEYAAGDMITVTFEYNTNEMTAPRVESITCESANSAGIATCNVSYPLMAFPTVDIIAMFVTPFVAGLIALGIAITLIYLRPFDANGFMAVVTLLPLSLTMGGLFDVGTSHQLIPVWHISGALLGSGLITFAMVFPIRLPFVYRNPYYRFIPYGLGALLFAYTLIAFSTEPGTASPMTNQVVTVYGIIGLAITAALMGFYHRRHAVSVLHRDQANVLLIGMLLALALAGVWLSGRILPIESDPLLSIEAFMPFLIAPAISIAYSVLQYNTFDTDRVLSQGITYSLLLFTLIVGYFLLVLGASLFTTEMVNADNPLLIVVTIFFVSLLFVPLRTTLQRRIDEIYFRKRRDFQARLERFSQKLTSLAGPNVMIEEFRNLLEDTISPYSTLIFLRNPQTGQYIAFGDPQPETDITFEPESGVVQLLQNSDTTIYLQPGQPWPPELYADKARLGILRAMLIAGMAGNEALNGFVIIGPPRSQAEGYTFEELRFINNLVGQLSIAIERATVIQSLERSVQELEVLSQVSQAVNFTIEIDDLLELLSAQTLKLIQSPYFYIVLYDTPTDQLYFAFFLEHDERYQDIENKKWPIGQDLYSEIIQTGQPIRVDDYSQALARKNYRINYESADTKAWMGVPLTSGTQVLGVMAVGEVDPETRYTPEQLRIFGDIGALAASSLDKARLFSEANSRARQLAALNDISRQLVATEGDVERLLDLITNSAVDILNAEAGSLLLTAEDGSGDLEFRVAVGETGHELVGRRLSKGYGLVGRVAESGRPVISNDTSRDDGWQGEVVEEGFHTRSVLAVPLIAQENVIGVLEVINKRDGSVYVEEDVELLTTFAGQAAIAFENARLFQQTDLQLSQRVSELETLERIDRELNRNLELNSVAELTVRWAVSNSNATSGVLGIPTEDRAYLQIIAKQGYEEADAPEGAQGNLWPMDRGIVKRVVRTRRPDLQPYVSMDPEYVPSLRGALSQLTIPMIAGEEISAILILETDGETPLNLLDQDWVQRITEHASIAIENAKLYEEITQANKSKSKFMGFAAHELKNPLTSVKGYAASLGSSMAAALSADQIQQFAAIIQNNADRMQNIINDLRDIARDDAGQLKVQLEPTSLRQVVMDTLITLQKQIDGKEQTVANNISDDLPLIMADRQRLTQIMVNFVSNAHKYSPQEATITIDAQVIDNYVDRNRNNLGSMLHVSVSDTGMGMDEDTLSRLFNEDYFRSDNQAARNEEGTGLGMIITKRLIESHKGEVWVESTPGEGSTFHFVIPLAPDDATQDQDTEREETTEGASD